MNKQIVLKFAASALVLGTVAVGCKPAGGAHPATLSSVAPKPEKQIGKLAARAQKAIDAKRGDEAVALAEQTVALAPRDAAVRTLLGQAYLTAGRFISAETSFADALALEPGNGRAMLGRALAQIALGDRAKAVAALDAARGVVAETDRGLGLALAGEPQRSVEILEFAVRQPGSDAKSRQNLALGYALAGRWREAQVMASYDVAPAEVTNRIMQWARFARPSAASDQVASLLGVTPAADAGQPERLALAPLAAEPVALAAVEPVVVPVPAAIAAVAPAMMPTEPEAPAVVAEAEQLPLPYQAAPAAVMPVHYAAPMRVAKAAPARRIVESPLPVRQIAQGKFAVQVGAFSTADRAEAGWTKTQKRFAKIAAFQPSHATFTMQHGATYHRLSLAGFNTRAEAGALCARLKSVGGDCFVRSTAGDTAMRFVQTAGGGQRWVR